MSGLEHAIAGWLACQTTGYLELPRETQVCDAQYSGISCSRRHEVVSTTDAHLTGTSYSFIVRCALPLFIPPPPPCLTLLSSHPHPLPRTLHEHSSLPHMYPRNPLFLPPDPPSTFRCLVAPVVLPPPPSMYAPYPSRRLPAPSWRAASKNKHRSLRGGMTLTPVTTCVHSTVTQYDTTNTQSSTRSSPQVMSLSNASALHRTALIAAPQGRYILATARPRPRTPLVSRRVVISTTMLSIRRSPTSLTPKRKQRSNTAKNAPWSCLVRSPTVGELPDERIRRRTERSTAATSYGC